MGEGENRRNLHRNCCQHLADPAPEAVNIKFLTIKSKKNQHRKSKGRRSAHCMYTSLGSQNPPGVYVQ